MATKKCPKHGRAYKLSCIDCSKIITDWQDDRCYLENERALDQRLDRCRS